MENQFYVGQRVRSEKYGEGVVESISTGTYKLYPVKCRCGKTIYSFTKDGRFMYGEPVSLFPIDPPASS